MAWFQGQWFRKAPREPPEEEVPARDMASSTRTMGERLCRSIRYDKNPIMLSHLHHFVEPKVWDRVINGRWVVATTPPERHAKYPLEHVVDRHPCIDGSAKWVSALLAAGARVALLTREAQGRLMHELGSELEYEAFIHLMNEVCVLARCQALCGLMCFYHCRGVSKSLSMTKFIYGVNECAAVDVNMADLSEHPQKKTDGSPYTAFTLLRWALVEDNIDMARILLEAGASPNDSGCMEVYAHRMAHYPRNALDATLELRQKMSMPMLLLFLQHGLDVRVACKLLNPAEGGDDTQDGMAFLAKHPTMSLQHLAAVSLRRRWTYEALEQSGKASPVLLSVIRRCTGRND